MNKIIFLLLLGLALNANRISVHDPSIFVDNGKYYIFGSHVAAAYSTDLINWKSISTDYQNPTANPLYGNLNNIFKHSFYWAGYNDADTAGGKYAVWAPDIIYNKDYVWPDGRPKGAYLLYYSTSSTWRRSCIGVLASKRVDSGYKYVNTFIFSGFTNTGKVNYDGNSRIDTTWSKSYLNLKDLVNNKVIDSNFKTWKAFNNDGTWNQNYAPNAIDPTIFTNARGNQLFLVYGSWSGGIYILEINKSTGLPKFPGKDGVEPKSGNYIDRYFGTHIAGGNHMSGEGPYIRYDKNTGFYFLFLTYGGFLSTGGYNMRMFRAKNLYGPYYDPAGNKAQDSGRNVYKFGVKLIGNYAFSGQKAYVSAGHNSFLITDDGKYFLVFHQRFYGKGERHEVRVRQMFLNQDNWPVPAVYEYKKETIAKYSENDVIGNYEYINHGNAESCGDMIKTQRISLNKGGSITGSVTGTWSMTNGSSYTYVTLNIGGVAYKGYFFKQADDNKVVKMTFSAIGKNNLAIWGSKI